MTKPVDLDALDAAHAAATPGEWSASTPYREIDGSERCFVSKQNKAPIVGITITAETQFEADARAIAAYHNAYPEMAAELRALREVAEAARAFVPEQARVLLGFGKIHPLTRLDSRVSALVDALAKVPR